MSIEVAVISTDPKHGVAVQLDQAKLIDTLGEEDQAIAVRIDELVQSISETVSRSIESESELLIEIAGSVTLTAKGEVKWLLFNVGGSAKASDTLKVTLKTKISPETTRD